MSAPLGVDTRGLVELVRDLKGPLWRDVNRELRYLAPQIAADLVPLVQAAVASSPAPQARKVAPTVRAHRDRVPVVVVGKTNPRLSGFSRRGPRRDGGPRADIKLRRGQLAHGVIYGPLGGRRDAPGGNYYKIPRDPSGGRVGRTLDYGGPVFQRATEEYLRAFLEVMARNGWPTNQLRAA